MPRASWRGYLRLSLVSCPVYLLPATVRTKPIRLHQVWRATSPDQEVDVSEAIIGQRTEKFDPSMFRDRYQEALRELIEAKMKGLPIKAREISTPPPVIDLMAALKSSLVQAPPTTKGARTNKRANAAPDRRQRALLLPVSGGRKDTVKPATEPTTVASRGRKKA